MRFLNEQEEQRFLGLLQPFLDAENSEPIEIRIGSTNVYRGVLDKEPELDRINSEQLEKLEKAIDEPENSEGTVKIAVGDKVYKVQKRQVLTNSFQPSEQITSSQPQPSTTASEIAESQSTLLAEFNEQVEKQQVDMAQLKDKFEKQQLDLAQLQEKLQKQTEEIQKQRKLIEEASLPVQKRLGNWLSQVKENLTERLQTTWESTQQQFQNLANKAGEFSFFKEEKKRAKKERLPIKLAELEQWQEIAPLVGRKKEQIEIISRIVDSAKGMAKNNPNAFVKISEANFKAVQADLLKFDRLASEKNIERQKAWEKFYHNEIKGGVERDENNRGNRPERELIKELELQRNGREDLQNPDQKWVDYFYNSFKKECSWYVDDLRERREREKTEELKLPEQTKQNHTQNDTQNTNEGNLKVEDIITVKVSSRDVVRWLDQASRLEGVFKKNNDYLEGIVRISERVLNNAEKGVYEVDIAKKDFIAMQSDLEDFKLQDRLARQQEEQKFDRDADNFLRSIYLEKIQKSSEQQQSPQASAEVKTQLVPAKEPTQNLTIVSKVPESIERLGTNVGANFSSDSTISPPKIGQIKEDIMQNLNKKGYVENLAKNYEEVLSKVKRFAEADPKEREEILLTVQEKNRPLLETWGLQYEAASKVQTQNSQQEQSVSQLPDVNQLQESQLPSQSQLQEQTEAKAAEQQSQPKQESQEQQPQQQLPQQNPTRGRRR